MGAFIRLPHHKSPCRQYVDGASYAVTRRRELRHQVIFDQPLKWREAAKNDVHLKAIGNGILLVSGGRVNVLKGQKTVFSVQISRGSDVDLEFSECKWSSVKSSVFHADIGVFSLTGWVHYGAALKATSGSAT